MAYDKGNHKGVRNFTGEEVSGLVFGQAGFDILDPNTHEAGVGDYADVKFWVAVKAVGHASDAATVKARSVTAAGGDLTGDGAVYASGTDIELSAGDIVFGAFDKIEVGASDLILAYRG